MFGIFDMFVMISMLVAIYDEQRKSNHDATDYQPAVGLG
jgi:hypothetical protein